MDFQPLLRWLREAFLEHLGLKAMAFAFAIGFFGYVHTQENIQQRTIPISVISLPPSDGSQELMTLIPASIHVTLRGSRRTMNDLVQEGVRPVEVDLRRGFPTEITFNRTLFSLPPQLELVVVDPPELKLEWEPVITRQIPLQASITGTLPEGFSIRGEPTVDPPQITVRGPRSRVEILQFARLVPFNVSGLTEGTYPRRIGIDPEPDRVHYLGTHAATVVVEVKRRESERLFSERTVQVIGPVRSQVLPRTVDVTIIGPPDVVRALRPEQIIPQADLILANKWADGAPSTGSVTVPLTVPISGVRAEVQPPSATIKW